MEENRNQENAGDRGSNILLRCASQNSLDESSQRPAQASPPQPPAHAVRALEALHQLRKQGLLCDVKLVAGDVEVSAHRVVLAAISPYFKAMFTQFEERSRDTITIQNVEPMALEALIDYMYDPDSLEVTEDNVQMLLPAANLLQVLEVREQCCTFLSCQLHPTNVLGIRAFGDMHACQQLAQHAQQFIEAHFAEVIDCEEFLQLTHEHLAKLLASDRLTVPSEEKILDAVILWVDHEPETRRQHLAELMEHVRLPLLTQECLVGRVQSEPLLSGDMKCKDLLIEALAYHLMRPEQRLVAAANSVRAKPRQPQGAPKVLMVIGGQAPKAIRNVECYDLEEGKWYNAGDMLTRRCRAGVGVVDGKVYAVGGFNGTLRVRTVDIYDPMTGQWSPGPSMEARRSTLGVAVVGHLLYAVGGFDGTTGLGTAEVLDTKSGLWGTIAAMSTRRSSVGVAVLQGKVYAVGGYDGASRQCLSSVECYDPETDSWSPLPDMSARRSGAGVGVLDGILYAVGGHDGPAVRKSVEAWDPSTGLWREVSSMSCARRNAGVTVHSGHLIAVGGDDGTTNLATAEQYDPVADTWSMLPVPMCVARSYAGVAVLDRCAAGMGEYANSAAHTNRGGSPNDDDCERHQSDSVRDLRTIGHGFEPTAHHSAYYGNTLNGTTSRTSNTLKMCLNGSSRLQHNRSPAASASQTVEFHSRPSTSTANDHQYIYATLHELPPRFYNTLQDSSQHRIYATLAEGSPHPGGQRSYAALNEVYDVPRQSRPAARPCTLGRHFALCTRARMQWVLVRNRSDDAGAAECDRGGWIQHGNNSRAEGQEEPYDSDGSD